MTSDFGGIEDSILIILTKCPPPEEHSNFSTNLPLVFSNNNKVKSLVVFHKQSSYIEILIVTSSSLYKNVYLKESFFNQLVCSSNKHLLKILISLRYF